MSQEIIFNKWHSLDWVQAVKKLKSDDKNGLSEKEVRKRQKKLGRNLFPRKKPISNLKIFLDQFKSPLIYILVIAGIVVLLFEKYTDAIVIFGAVILNTIVGYFQEHKASKALLKLKQAVQVQAKVIREGNTKIVDVSDLVPGDIIILGAGDKAPADARIIESNDLKINEMILTGEWLSAEKKSKTLDEKTPLADRDNMVYMGTIVEHGRGKAIVTAIGLKTEMGKVAQMVKEAREGKTLLQKKLSYFAGTVGVIIGIISLIVFIEGLIAGSPFLEIFTIAIAVAVAGIPEGLPIAMTVILALGMQRILKKKGLVRKLLAAETLGSTSLIATDKTLTLTEGKMAVSDIFVGKELLDSSSPLLPRRRDDKGLEENKLLALKIAALTNEAFIENPEDSIEKWIIRGRPTDKALLLAGLEAGFNKKELEKTMSPLAEIPFDSINKYSARAFALDRKKDIVYIAGAPEKLLEMSYSLKMGRRNRILTPEMKEKIEAQLENLTKKGLRVVAVGYKEIENLKDLVNGLTFVGLIGLRDPIRRGVKKAIKICKQAGMRPIIITGDHKLTAQAVAEEIGIRVKKKNIIEGKDLDRLSDKEFEKRLLDIEIYARVEPKHKMRIISAWQEKGEVVAMTGDGINDAPALRKADIGIALGSGTEVAKEVSDLILLTDNFNIIVAAVAEGRAIIDNIRKVITYLVSDAFTEIILVGTGIFFGLPLPVTAAQILWVNLIEDGFPSIALAFEPKEKDLMKRKPEGHNIPLLGLEMKAIIFIIGLITNLILLGLFFWLWKKNLDIAYIRTMMFVGLTTSSLFYIFSCKNLRRNLWHIDIFSNKLLIFAWLFGIAMLISAIYLLPLQILLKTVPLGFYDWLIIISLSLIELVLIEGTKWIFIRSFKF